MGGRQLSFPPSCACLPPLTDLMRIQAETRSLQTAGSIMPLNSPRRHTSPLEAQFALAGKAWDTQETSEFSGKARACLSLMLPVVGTFRKDIAAPSSGVFPGNTKLGSCVAPEPGRLVLGGMAGDSVEPRLPGSGHCLEQPAPSTHQSPWYPAGA